MSGFKQFLTEQGVDVEALQKKTFSAKLGAKMLKDLRKKYRRQPPTPNVN